MKHYDDNIEKYLTAVFGTVGSVAILISLYLKGADSINVLDAVKDISGMIVVVSVFLITNRMFRKGAKLDFSEVFELHLKEWVKRNDYLITDPTDGEGKGKYKKRFCSMVIDHSNMVTKAKKANDAVPNKEKGAFVYLPYEDDNGQIKNEFEFRFNERTFERQGFYKSEDGKVQLGDILRQIASRIDDNFKSLGIKTKVMASSKTIVVSYEDMDQTEVNAKRLIDLVEYVKTLVLALS